MKKCICFIFDKSYFAQGSYAISSAKLHNPDHVTILLTNDISDLSIADIVLTPNDIGTDTKNWLTIGRVSIVEHALKILNFDTAIFIDGDTYTYANYDSLQKEVNNHSIVVIPHTTKPLPNDGRLPAQNTISLAGNYNSGVWASSKDGLSFLSWWKQQTSIFPIMNPGNGFFNEQGWLRFAADFDSNTKIFRHPGYNVSYWNIKQRILNIKNNKYYIDNEPLSIMHFSGLKKELDPSKMSIFQNRYMLEENDLVYILYRDYYNLIWR